MWQYNAAKLLSKTNCNKKCVQKYCVSYLRTHTFYMTSKLINALIPVFAGTYFLLLLHRVVNLPAEQQLKFDNFVRNKKKWLIVLCWLVIVLPVVAYIMQTFFTKTVWVEKPTH